MKKLLAFSFLLFSLMNLAGQAWSDPTSESSLPLPTDRSRIRVVGDSVYDVVPDDDWNVSVLVTLDSSGPSAIWNTRNGNQIGYSCAQHDRRTS